MSSAAIGGARDVGGCQRGRSGIRFPLGAIEFLFAGHRGYAFGEIDDSIEGWR